VEQGPESFCESFPCVEKLSGGVELPRLFFLRRRAQQQLKKCSTVIALSSRCAGFEQRGRDRNFDHFRIFSIEVRGWTLGWRLKCCSATVARFRCRISRAGNISSHYSSVMTTDDTSARCHHILSSSGGHGSPRTHDPEATESMP
jgi:hypothetical protein